ncbi:UNVERIFIED_CONTAM: hypothetical protein FKN15_067576 [Acipenser sinensis]
MSASQVPLSLTGWEGECLPDCLTSLDYDENKSIVFRPNGKVNTDGLVLKGWYNCLTLAVYGTAERGLSHDRDSPPPPPPPPPPPQQQAALKRNPKHVSIDKEDVEEGQEDFFEPISPDRASIPPEDPYSDMGELDEEEAAEEEVEEEEMDGDEEEDDDERTVGSIVEEDDEDEEEEDEEEGEEEEEDDEDGEVAAQSSAVADSIEESAVTGRAKITTQGVRNAALQDQRASSYGLPGFLLRLLI